MSEVQTLKHVLDRLRCFPHPTQSCRPIHTQTVAKTLHTGKGLLRTYCRLAKENGVKLEVECFSTGGYWAVRKIREGRFYNAKTGKFEEEKGLLPDPIWIELLFGWTGQGWAPPTPRALNYMVDHLPPDANYHVSCLGPEAHWPMITHAIALGGNIRTGMEDCPYLDNNGTLARSNAELIEKAVKISRAMGREIATPDEARKIIGLPQPR